MVEYFMQWLSRWDPNFLSDVFVGITVLLFLAALWAIARGRHQPFIQFAPTLLTSLGILGTFTGITVGLGNFSFDTRQAIDQSIPQLLGGLKMAFVTSIAGMTLSLIAKSFATWKAKLEAVSADQIGPADILAAMSLQHEAILELRRAVAGEGDASVITQLQKVRSDIHDGLSDTRRLISQEGQASIGDRLDAIHSSLEVGRRSAEETRTLTRVIAETGEATRRAISGDGDSSLVTQLQRLRTDLQERLERLVAAVSTSTASTAEQIRSLGDRVLGEGGRSLTDQLAESNGATQEALSAIRADLREFAEKVSELGSKALIEALSSVIQDFNQKITEQFGDNFKRLDDSVGKLVQWQDEYRNQMADMKNGFEIAVQAVQESRNALEAVRRDAEAIPGLIGRLEDVMNAAFVYLNDMERHLAAFAEVKERAVSAIPLMQEHMDKLLQEVAGAVRTSTEHHGALIANSDALIGKFKASTEELHKKFVSETTDMVDWITTHLKDTANDVSKRNQEASEAMQKAGKALEDSMDGVKQRLVASVGKLDEFSGEMSNKLQETITRSFSEQNNHVQQISRSLREESQRAAADRTELLNTELRKIDEAMQTEIARIMQQMGNALVTISNKFVTDYKQFMEASADLMKVAQRVQREGRRT